MSGNGNWSDDDKNEVTKLWFQGCTAGQIAAALPGNRTRNAVISLVHRLKLKRNESLNQINRANNGQNWKRVKAERDAAAAGKPKPQRRPPSMRPLTPLQALLNTMPTIELPKNEELVIPPAERQTVETIEAHHCRWPIGDPRQKDFHFCGKNKVTGLPYCEFHARRAFQPTVAKRAAGAPVVSGRQTASAGGVGANDNGNAAPAQASRDLEDV